MEIEYLYSVQRRDKVTHCMMYMLHVFKVNDMPDTELMCAEYMHRSALCLVDSLGVSVPSSGVSIEELVSLTLELVPVSMRFQAKQSNSLH
jgi:hypothetical protein